MNDIPVQYYMVSEEHSKQLISTTYHLYIITHKMDTLGITVFQNNN